MPARLSIVIAAIFSMVVLSACGDGLAWLMPGNTPERHIAGDLERESPDQLTAEKLQSELSDAAGRSARANQVASEVQLAASETGVEPPFPAGRTLPDINELPEALKTPYTVRWTGGLDALVKSIAMSIDYEFVVTGHPPAQPVTLTLHRESEPVWRILRDVGIAVRDRATIALRPARKRVELIYPIVPLTSDAEPVAP